MINVNIERWSLEELSKNGFILEHGDNIITIRNIYGKLLIEIIYFEETNKILINRKKGFDWCDKIIDIRPSEDKLSMRIRYKNKNYFKTIAVGED